MTEYAQQILLIASENPFGLVSAEGHEYETELAVAELIDLKLIKARRLASAHGYVVELLNA